MAQRLGNLKYIQDHPRYRKEKPFTLSMSTYAEKMVSNIIEETRPVELTDVRGSEARYSLNTHSFRFMSLPTTATLDQTEASTIRYIEEMQSFLLDEFDADRVICYDIRRRDSSYASEPEEPDSNYFGALQVAAPPVASVHVDHSLEGGLNRMCRHLTADEVDKYLQSGWRARIVNIWRPLRPVVISPLVVCDYKTVDSTDLVETDQVNEDWLGEIYRVKYNPAHRFYWLSNQQPSEICVMLQYDSHAGQPESDMHCCAHASLSDAEGSSNGTTRQSVEIRAIVLSESQC